MATRHRPPAGRPARHLVAVPDSPEQPLGDIAEVSRLAYLRRLATETGQPAEAIRLIEGAATADDALESLVAAGLMPGGERSLDDMLAWFAPLLEPGCDQVTAEIAASQFVAEVRRWVPEGADVAEPLLAVVADAASDRRYEAVAMLRALAAVGPDEVRSAASAAATRQVGAGRPDLPWASGLGSPQPGPCFGYEDSYGEQRSVVLSFRYGNTRHALVTLIDYGLGGGLKDLYVCDYSDRLRGEYRAIGQRPDMRYRDYDRGAARAILDDALARPACPVEQDQADNVADHVELLRARVALLPAVHQVRPQPRSTPTGPRSERTVHQLKVTLRGCKPPIWRRFEVPSDITLGRLHTVIQIGFGWQDSHLHVFETSAGRYGCSDPDLEIRGDSSKRLSAVADSPGDRIGYEYDFGDGWEHDIAVEAVRPADPGVRYPRCTAGRKACPPEDCGGVAGYYHLLDVLANPRHSEHAERLAWLSISSPAGFDPERFDRDAVNLALARRARVLVRP